MISEVLGKKEFLDAWTLKHCRGAGIELPIPKEIFDGTGTRHQEFLTKPFWFNCDPDKADPHGLIDANFLLRIAAGWGSLADVQLLVKHVEEVARLVFSAHGDPNAVMDEDFGGSEGECWFFKSTPLMRVVASGNLLAVNALLNIGADPLIPRIGKPEETLLLFAVRRARVNVLKALAGSVTTDLLWKRDPYGSRYLLDSGGLALHPVLRLEMDNDSQFETYVTCGPWTQELVVSQRKTNSLHLCAEAGEYSRMMREDLLRSVLPASRWDITPETLRHQNKVNFSCEKPLEIDPIVDCRNELAQTPFFCALQAEEYQMAFALYQAGASQNVTIPHRILGMAGRRLPYDIDEGLPLVEHVLTWTSAY
ncbi:hypothetical protein F52700_5031 [Fusarium sp. NRRL 52700]|nr:hypothetical protein F52700_5031 [Fusarium sp. NRRL 52700]